MKFIFLTNSDKVAFVSDRDFVLVREHTWWESQGYAVMAKPRKGRASSPLVSLHVFLLGIRQGKVIDHKNGNGLDCRRSNLRFATHQQNIFNSRKCRKKTSSGFKGVSWHSQKGKWRAYIKHNFKQVSLGLHDFEKDAARAYNRAASRLFGKHARLNTV